MEPIYLLTPRFRSLPFSLMIDAPEESNIRTARQLPVDPAHQLERFCTAEDGRHYR
ncbi:MAG: hypothetical protein ACMUIA_08870 [bacterium]